MIPGAIGPIVEPKSLLGRFLRENRGLRTDHLQHGRPQPHPDHHHDDRLRRFAPSEAADERRRAAHHQTRAEQRDRLPRG